jgi:hypothetical protein
VFKNTSKATGVRVSTETVFPTPTISFIYYGKIMFDLRAHFQERNCHTNREVAAPSTRCLLLARIILRP